jgi:elongation factor G
VQKLLDAIVAYLPSPLDVPPVEGINPFNNKEESREVSDDAPFSALVFKMRTDEHIGKLTYIRVYSGVAKAGSQALNTTNQQKERMGRLVQMHANKREERDAVYCGDIAAVVGLKKAATGDTLCDPRHPIKLETMQFPEPVIFVAIEPKTKSDEDKLATAMEKLSEEDPTFQIKTDEETGQTIISGMGELHLEILIDRMLREFKVGANVGNPQVAYKESIMGEADAETKFVKQTGGRGQYAHIVIHIERNSEGDDFVFENKIVGGTIPKQFIPSVERGMKDAMSSGIIAGYPVTGVRATLLDGSFHEVDSSEIAFRMAGSMALRDALKKAGPILLEPIMGVEVIVPHKYMGDVISDLNMRRGKVEGMFQRPDARVVTARVPLSELFGYATTLRSLSQGRAIYSMQFSRYEELPNHIADEFVNKYQGRIVRS